jgi:UDP-glucuronate 4-epimerase
MTVLVTGAAGFVGQACAAALLARGETVLGLDNLNTYYDPELKKARLKRFEGQPGFAFEKLDVADRDGVAELFKRHRPTRVVHMAAQAGVRYSLEAPHAYLDSNLAGFLNILEGCRAVESEHLVFASSSSVYGGNVRLPYRVDDAVDHPLSLYAATKKANELMAHTYAHLYRLPVTGLRFFTVYGPWGRPDMAPILFATRVLRGETIDVFNNGDHKRDFTYIDDIVEGVIRVLDQPAAPDPAFNRAAPTPESSDAPYRVYNIGNGTAVALMDFIAAIETATGKAAVLRNKPMQPGDVHETLADVSALKAAVGFAPDTPVEAGVTRLVAWVRDYYGFNGD